MRDPRGTTREALTMTALVHSLIPSFVHNNTAR
jgi:hypothetical protein